jgi:hypothetical protein
MANTAAEQKKTITLNQKIFEISELLEITKDKSKSGHYRFYNIEDVLTILKPLLHERRLLLRFKHGGIRDNIYNLCLEVIDLETNEKIEDEDSQLIDVNPKVMSLAQSVNVSKTFLKKNLLNNLFNIKEPDPDYDPTQPPKPKTPQQTPNDKPQTPTQPSKPNDKKATEGQLKRYFAIAKSREVDVAYMDELILKAFNLAKKEDWLMNDYNKFMEYFAGDDKKNIKGHSNEETISMLIKKEKSKKK